MKILILPGNNSLSHIAKCLALDTCFSSRGHTVRIAVTPKHAPFMNRLSRPFSLLPDIQESDDGALPSVAWFSSFDRIKQCIQSEIKLIEAFKPDRVIGVFRFTAKASATITRVPFESLACGCMMPDVGEVLGYAWGEANVDIQAQYLNNFYQFAARKMSWVIHSFGLQPVKDIRCMLTGEKTYLWDFPQFMPVRLFPGRHHVGPVQWHQWPDTGVPPPPFKNPDRPMAVVSLGTCQPNMAVVIKTVRCLLNCGYNVMMACGGHAELLDLLPCTPRLRKWRFAPLAKLLCRAAILVCHGGQMTIFEALHHCVPVLVVPSQPEQAHNGVCLERIGCGARLSPPIPFKGNTSDYEDAFIGQAEERIVSVIQNLSVNDNLSRCLTKAKNHLDEYNGALSIADLVEA